MNIAERILQNRFSIPKPDYPSAEEAQPPPPPPPPINQPVPSSYHSPHSKIYPQPHPQSIHYNIPKKPQQKPPFHDIDKKKNHFTINHQTKPIHTRPHSAKFKKKKYETKPKMALTPPTKPSNYLHKRVPPIPIQQSYTPPSYPPNPPMNTSNSLNSWNMLHPNRVNTNEYQSHKHNELPLGWAKLKDKDGLYYFNVITGAKQRNRPHNDAPQQNDASAQPKMQPYAHNAEPSAMTDAMSVAEMEYRKNNGSMIFANIISDSDINQLIRQENWDMLVDAIYLNLSVSDYVQVFKALRSIAENLFDEDDKYRILYADNKKVQQRILSRIGGYEFLRGLGFREITKRKLVCDAPDFDVVATAITSINAKLSLLEKKKLPIIPSDIVDQNESIELDVDIDDYLSNKKKMDLIELKLDNVVSSAIKSEEKQSRLYTNEMDLNEGEEGYRDFNKQKSEITSVYYSDEEDAKQPIIIKSHSNIMETDAGFDETEEYLAKQNKRKRSLSWDNKDKLDNKHRYTLPPKNTVFMIQNRSLHNKRSNDPIQRSSSLTSPRHNISCEVDRAYVDSERKLTLQALQMNEEEDIESLFDDDCDNKDDNNKNVSCIDVMDRRNFHFGYGYNGYNRGRNTLSEGNLSAVWNRNINNNNNRNISQSPQSARLRQSPKPMEDRVQKRSNSFGDNWSILLPSEKKKIQRKENKKMAKKKTAQKIRKSVGAIWNAFSFKHKHNDDDYKAYYGDPQKEDIMTPNILFNKKHKVELIFEDETKVEIDVDININCIKLICLSLEQRGWNQTMSHLFNLSNNYTTFKDDEKPILSNNYKFIIKYKKQ